MRAIYVGNDMIATISRLRNTVTDEYLNDASANLTVKDENGNPVDGMTWPVLMDYVDASDGGYQATIESTVDLVENKFYTAEIVVVRGEFNGLFVIPLLAKYRTR